MVTAEVGLQAPRIWHAPEANSSRGQEAVEWARSVGLELDPWQEFVLEHGLGVVDDRWAAFEVGLDAARQNGKGGILEAREGAGLFVFGEKLLIHSAHEFSTSLEAFMRLENLIDSSEELSRQVKRVIRSHGEEGINLVNGNRIRFRTRTKGGGRGFSCDCLILDEAMFIAEMAHGALLPTLSARPNPQVWYTGSAVDQHVHDNGVVFSRVRKRGLEGNDPRLAYFEWSVDAENPADLTDEQLRDPGLWAQANPALGIRISPEHIEVELRSLDARTFAVERLCVGDWPSTDPDVETVIRVEGWRKLVDTKSKVEDPVSFALDVAPDRSFSTISAAGKRADGLSHIEVVEHKRRTGWVVDRAVELGEAHENTGFVIDSASPAASLIPELEQRGIVVTTVGAREYAQACGFFLDQVEEERLRHLGSLDLEKAVRGVATRPLGDSWAWSRKSSAVTITPLVACTLALWGSILEREQEQTGWRPL